MQRFGLCSAVLLFLFLAFIHGYRWCGEGESKHGALNLLDCCSTAEPRVSSLGGCFSLGRILWSFKFVVGSSSGFFCVIA